MRDGGGYAGGGFPDPPEGSPGGIRGAARALKDAAREMHGFAHGLRAAQGALDVDWEGYASGVARAASTGLAAAGGNGASTFAACADAVDGYADALEHAQDRIRHLRALWQAAMTRQATLGSQLGGLSTQLAGAEDDEIDTIQGRISSLSRQQAGAQDDAERYAREARSVKHHFEGESHRHAALLSGQTVPAAHGVGGAAAPFAGGPGSVPGVGSGLSVGTGGGFGIPAGGLSPFDGRARVGDPWNSPIPGYGVYMDATHPLEEVDDLTVAVTFFAGGVASIGVKTLGAAAREVVTAGAERLGIGAAGRAGIERAGTRAYQQAFEALPSRSTSWQVRGRAGWAARRQAEAEARAGIAESRGKAVKTVLNGARRLGVKIPDGLPDVAQNLVRFSDFHRAQALAQLARVQARLAESNAPGALHAARVLSRATGVPVP